MRTSGWILTGGSSGAIRCFSVKTYEIGWQINGAGSVSVNYSRSLIDEPLFAVIELFPVGTRRPVLEPLINIRSGIKNGKMKSRLIYCKLID
jgi:hypothetical protein